MIDTAKKVAVFFYNRQITPKICLNHARKLA
jgi:hypothetical protein